MGVIFGASSWQHEVLWVKILVEFWTIDDSTLWCHYLLGGVVSQDPTRLMVFMVIMDHRGLLLVAAVGSMVQVGVLQGSCYALMEAFAALKVNKGCRCVSG
jgi:hypothetical protein